MRIDGGENLAVVLRGTSEVRWETCRKDRWLRVSRLGGRRIKWSVEDMVIFQGIVGVYGSMEFPTAQTSLAPICMLSGFDNGEIGRFRCMGTPYGQISKCSHGNTIND